MSDKVVTFPVVSRGVPLEPVQEVLDHLREVLAAAERGEVRAVAMATVLAGESIRCGTAWGETEPILAELVTGVTVLQRRVLDDVAAGRVP